MSQMLNNNRPYHLLFGETHEKKNRFKSNERQNIAG